VANLPRCSERAEELHCCDRLENGAWENDREMPTSEKDRLAVEAMDRWKDFQESLASEKRNYPIPAVSSLLVGSNALRRIDQV
jgi:hypothetical protein